MSDLLPVFLKLEGRSVLLVGGGRVARAKLASLLAPERGCGSSRRDPPRSRRAASPSSAAVSRPPTSTGPGWPSPRPPRGEPRGRRAAEPRRVFVNAVDDPGPASAYLGGVVRKGGVVLAVSTEGQAPALAGLLREALEAALPDDVGGWVEAAAALRARQKAAGCPSSGADRRCSRS